MRCNKCGAELPEGAGFCGSCGAPVEKVQKKNSMPVVPIVVGAAVLVIAVIALVVVFVIGKKDDGQAVSGESTTENAVTEVAVEDMTPLYSITDVATINTYEQRYTPGVKQEGIKWDSTLFYWLEDVDQNSSEDGYLAKCHISKTLLRSAETGELIQYEIYRDPESNVIYKIVSIESKDGQLELIDYYYDADGKPNFAFKRTDSIYTPTYATISKVGERYYFNNDVLARWRLIHEPSVVGEYVLTPTEGGTWYFQSSYFAETDVVRGLYDEAEMTMLNAAYNTYNAVSEQAVGMVEGKVQDTTGTPLAGLTIDILRTSDDVLLYRGTTGEDGSFRILTYMDNTECYIVIRGNDSYKENSIYGVLLSDNSVSNAYNNLLLHKEGGDEYPVHMNVYAAVDVHSNEDGSLARGVVQGTTVSIRSGAGAYTGEVIATAQADAEGNISAYLQSGTYTAQLEAPGYSASFMEIEVSEQEATVEGYMLPSVATGQTGVVLTWDGADIDLDLTLFTPRQAADGDMAHISATSRADDYGNLLLADNKAGCEVMYINTAEAGSYKLYVNNYTDSISGNYSSHNLSNLNIHIYIYDSNGFVAEYTFPIGEVGVVWEVVEINGSQVTPSNRVYSSVEGKSWWTENKEKKVLRKEIYYLDGVEDGYKEYDETGMSREIRPRADGCYGEWLYDSAGKVIRTTSYLSDGSVETVWGYSYDDFGNLISEYAERSGETEPYFLYQYENEYDEAGRIIKQIVHNERGYVQTVVNKYDDAGRLIEQNRFKEGENTYSTVNEYDEAGHLILEKEYDGDMVVYVAEYTYDEYGNETQSRWIEILDTGEISYSGGCDIEYEYDARGNILVKKEWPTHDAIYILTEYTYDEQDNLLQSIRYDYSYGVQNEELDRTYITEYIYNR